MNRAALFFWAAFSLPLATEAQENWGAAHSNFAGIMGLGLNPSSIVDAPYSSEFSLLSLDIFADNNYVYLKKGYGIFNSTSSGEGSNSDHGATGDDYTADPLKKGYISQYLWLPSYIRNYGNEAWAIHGGLRSTTSIIDIPHHLAKFIYEGFNYKPQQQIDYLAGPYELEGMSWYELGGTYSRVLTRANSTRNIIKGGITVNLVLGTNGLYLQEQNMDYIVPQDGLLVVNDINAEYGHALPDDYRSPGKYFAIRGTGVATNIGFTYIHKLNRAAYACRAAANSLPKYDFRIGVSLIDFGFVNFTSRDAATFRFVDASTYWPGIDTTSFTSWTAMDTMLSNRFYGDPYQSAYRKTFKLWLPTAVSIQGDVNIKTNFFVNLTWIQRVPMNSLSVLRPSQVVLTPRYEKRKFEVDVPLTFYDYDKMALGLAVRYGVVTIGTDRLGIFTGLFDSYAFDFFLSIRWTRCEQGDGRAKKGNCPATY